MTDLKRTLPAAGSTRPGASEPPADRFGKIETLGIDVIDDASRHGRPRELFSVWLASNVAYIYIIVGGLLTVLGLSVLQAVAVLVAGNLFWILVGFLAVSGSRSGTPSKIVTRAMFGVRGNRPLGAGVTWLICICYEGINLAIGSLAGFALIDFLGIEASTTVKVLVATVMGLVTFGVSIYGHATIVRFSNVLTVVLGACVLILGGFVVAHAKGAPAGFVSLQGADLWATALVGFTVVASLPLSWNNAADYARYLPADSSPRAVAGWTALGGWLPAMALGCIGVLAGTVVDMTDPQTSMAGILPSWFYGIFLTVLVFGSISNNILTTYSSGLALQALGVRMTRVRSIVIDAVLGGALCAYALISAHFLQTVNNVLALTVAVLAPGIAIYAVDIVMRRNDYDGPTLHDERPGSPYWYYRGFNLAGTVALLLGFVASILTVNTTVLVGPVSTALHGADLSAITGPIVAAVVYWAMTSMGLTGAKPRAAA